MPTTMQSRNSTVMYSKLLSHETRVQGSTQPIEIRTVMSLHVRRESTYSNDRPSGSGKAREEDLQELSSWPWREQRSSPEVREANSWKFSGSVHQLARKCSQHDARLTLTLIKSTMTVFNITPID